MSGMSGDEERLRAVLADTAEQVPHSVAARSELDRRIRAARTRRRRVTTAAAAVAALAVAGTSYAVTQGGGEPATTDRLAAAGDGDQSSRAEPPGSRSADGDPGPTMSEPLPHVAATEAKAGDKVCLVAPDRSEEQCVAVPDDGSFLDGKEILLVPRGDYMMAVTSADAVVLEVRDTSGDGSATLLERRAAFPDESVWVHLIRRGDDRDAKYTYIARDENGTVLARKTE